MDSRRKVRLLQIQRETASIATALLRAAVRKAQSSETVGESAESPATNVTLIALRPLQQFVHADAKNQWANPERGVVKRAENPSDGRMVDAQVFADSYAIRAQNHQAFYEHNRTNRNASFIFLENSAQPKQISGIPKEALSLNRHELAQFVVGAVQKMEGVPAHIKRGVTMGSRIWG